MRIAHASVHVIGCSRTSCWAVLADSIYPRPPLPFVFPAAFLQCRAILALGLCVVNCVGPSGTGTHFSPKAY